MNEDVQGLLVVLNDEHLVNPDIMYFIIQYIRYDIDIIQTNPELRYELIEAFKKRIKPNNMFRFVKKTAPAVIVEDLVFIELSNIVRRKLHFCFLINSYQSYLEFFQNYPDLKSIIIPIIIYDFEKPQLVHITNQLLNLTEFKEFGNIKNLNHQAIPSKVECLIENPNYSINTNKSLNNIVPIIQQDEIGNVLISAYEIVKNEIYQITLANHVYMKVGNFRLTCNDKTLDINFQNNEFYERINHDWHVETINYTIEKQDMNKSIYKETLMNNIKIDKTFFSNQKYIQFIRVYGKLYSIMTEKLKTKINHLELITTHFKIFW